MKWKLHQLNSFEEMKKLERENASARAMMLGPSAQTLEKILCLWFFSEIFHYGRNSGREWWCKLVKILTLKLKLEKEREKFKVHAFMFKVWVLEISHNQSEWKGKKRSNQPKCAKYMNSMRWELLNGLYEITFFIPFFMIVHMPKQSWASKKEPFLSLLSFHSIPVLRRLLLLFILIDH